MIIKTEVEITPRRIADLMVTAIEGGIGYWCESVKLLDQPRLGKMKKPWYDDESLYDHDPRSMAAALIKIEVKELDPSSKKCPSGVWEVELVNMEQAFILMQEYGKPKGWHFRNFINENDDAETADVWFQLAVFGEVVYS